MAKTCYVEKRFRAESLSLIESVNGIVDEYEELGFAMSVRQVFYQLVSRDFIPNTEKSYDRVINTVNDARLAGLIDWDAIEDRTRNLSSLAHWESPVEIMQAVASQFRTEKWRGQIVVPEVWVEKEALAGIVAQTAQRYDVGFLSCRGYMSQSEMHAAAMRYRGYARRGQEIRVIHLGDHDPSGIDMSRDIEDRLKGFLAHYNLGHRLSVERIALNMEQIEEHQPPPNPAKSSDSRFADYQERFGNESWELDALPPDVLDRLITNAIFSVRDPDQWEEDELKETEQKMALKAVSQNWNAVADFANRLEANQ